MMVPPYRAARALALALTFALSSMSTAHAADALLPESRTLFLTERFTPTTMRAPLAGAVQPHDVFTLRG